MATVTARKRRGESFMEKVQRWENDPVMQRIQPKGMPQLFGNEDFEMGESTIHTLTAGILMYGLTFHFAALTAYRVFGNLNLYYSADPTEYVSPDVMVVRLPRALPLQLTSYRIGDEGPGPMLVGEVLSFRTWQQGDLLRKPMLYSELGVAEYVLVDVTGDMLEQRLLLLRRQRDGSWRDERDADGGVTSRLGFRLLIEDDRPEEAQALADHAQAMTDHASALEEELARLRRASPKGKGRPRRKP
jgi:hypothetical protein